MEMMEEVFDREVDSTALLSLANKDLEIAFRIVSYG